MKVAIELFTHSHPSHGGTTNCFKLVCGHYAYFPASRGRPKTAWCKTCQRVHDPECNVSKSGGGLVACTCASQSDRQRSGEAKS